MAASSSSASASDSASASASASASMARANFELNNAIVQLDGSTLDSIFAYDNEAQRAMLRAQPWKADPHFFTKVRISAVALIKMVMHARSGGIYEIMGLMQGKIDVTNRTLYVMDSFALPVEGTETRVNAQNEAYEYMVQYLDHSKEVGRLENVVGWYHSHPGYGCWLSGIDVNTQRTNQQFQDPFVAIVIDPNRTISSGKVDIGAFRTFPEGYTPPSSTNGNNAEGEYQSIPLNKIEDFGVHASQYYPLEIEHFKSSLDTKLLDLLWNKYWQNTLAQSPLITNRAYTTEQIHDLAEKLAQSNNAVLARQSSSTLPFTPTPTTTVPTKPTRISHASTNMAEQEDNDGATVGKGKAKETLASTQVSVSTSTGSGSGSGGAGAGAGAGAGRNEDAESLVQDLMQRSQASALAPVTHDAHKLAQQVNHGLLALQLKTSLFSNPT